MALTEPQRRQVYHTAKVVFKGSLAKFRKGKTVRKAIAEN